MRTAAQKAPEAVPAPRASTDAAMEAHKRAFLRMVSHELRTPLNSILGFSEILATELYGPLGAPQYKEYAEIVRESGQKLLKLVNQLVEMARLETQVMDFDPRPEPLAPLLERVLAAHAEDMASGAVTATVIGEAKLPAVTADERGLTSLLSALVHNAIAFTPPGGEVRITATKRDGAVELALENPGDAIDPADLPRLMKPFEQGEAALTRRSHGAGLGLSIAALTAKAMGGALRLAARPEGGLIVTVTLPAA